MNKVYVILLLVGYGLLPAHAQPTRLEDLCQVFHIPNGKDTTTFVIFGTKDDLNVKKPLFLFRQGSRPTPFIIRDSSRYYLAGPFRFRDYKSDYHFAIIQKPGVRLVADKVYFDAYQKAIDQPNPPEEFVSRTYLANNYRERYVQQCSQVIDYLVKQPWIDARKVVYCGGSEGFDVGADLVATHNRHITHTILFSGSTNRRFGVVVQQIRAQIDQGEKSFDEGQAQLDKMYQVWADICANPTSTDKRFGDTYRAWYSFSQPSLLNLLAIKTPLYIAYGTADREMTSGLDVLPLEFTARGKNNLTLKPYFDHDHMFFKLKRNTSGKVIDRTYNGDAVAKDWMDWLRTTPARPTAGQARISK